MKKKIILYGLSVIVLFSVLAMVMPASAQPTADSFGVNDASGDVGTYVIVPVNITNAQNGPIAGVIFDISYDTGILSVVGRARGDRTSNWDLPYYHNFGWGTRVSANYDGVTEHAIQNGSTGSVVLLNFSLVGAGSSSMNLSNIQLSDISGMEVGTAPAKNGTFYVAGADTTDPVVTDPDANPSSIPADGTTTSQLNVTVTDNFAVASVTVNLSELGGSATQEMTKIDGTDIYTAITTAVVGTAPATYQLNVNATDTSGNDNNAVDILLGVTAPTAPPELETIVVLPASVILNIGDTQQFTAQGYDQFGNPIDSGIVYAWDSSDETVGTVNAAGFFEASAIGSTMVNATNGTVVGSASVTVSPIRITDFEVSDGTQGEFIEAVVNVTNEGETELNLLVVVSGLEEGGYPLAGITMVFGLADGEDITIPILVPIPAGTETGDYDLFADVFYGEGEEFENRIGAGPEVATVTSP